MTMICKVVIELVVMIRMWQWIIRMMLWLI